jgi:hypothetical protein
MCSTFSLSAKPCTGADNGKFLHSISLVTRARAEVIAAPKRSSQRAFPRLLKHGIPHTDLQVHEIVERQSQANSLSKQDICRKPEFHPAFLEEAYERCRNICAEYAKTFYLGNIHIPSTLFITCIVLDVMIQGFLDDMRTISSFRCMLDCLPDPISTGFQPVLWFIKTFNFPIYVITNCVAK